MLNTQQMTTKQSDQDLLTANYNYHLPPHLIADRPVEGRHHSRLLVYKAKSNVINHCKFSDLPTILPSKSHLVLNQSKVFPCRLLGQKQSGGSLEVFILSLIAQNNLYEVMIKASGKRKQGEIFEFDDLKLEIKKLSDRGTFWVKANFEREDFINFLENKANIPIPPYIRDGISDDRDKKDYQTVFAKNVGSVAAPTAGLHFTEDLFFQLSQKGINKSFVTLHVGAGTFKPVSAENIQDHQMHEENFTIDSSELAVINQHKDYLIAVGTTSLRVLESCWNNGRIQLPSNDSQLSQTSIFLYPGKKVNSIKGLITNFHLPESSLIMLVSALIGREKTLEIYNLAVQNEYRFYSYGDAMLILLEE